MSVHVLTVLPVTPAVLAPSGYRLRLCGGVLQYWSGMGPTIGEAWTDMLQPIHACDTETVAALATMPVL